jgi:ATP-binding cassette subfamily F protein 3
MHSVDLLIEALNKYEGSYILVSHDRYFVNKTANKIWEIEDYKIKEFVGTYDEWERWKAEKKAADNSSAKKKEVIAEKKVEIHAEKKHNHTSQNKEHEKELSKVKKQFQQLEEKISRLTVTKTKLEADLASPDVYLDKEKFIDAESRYKQNTSELQKVNKEYESLFERIMVLEEAAGLV